MQNRKRVKKQNARQQKRQKKNVLRLRKEQKKNVLRLKKLSIRRKKNWLAPKNAKRKRQRVPHENLWVSK